MIICGARKVGEGGGWHGIVLGEDEESVVEPMKHGNLLAIGRSLKAIKEGELEPPSRWIMAFTFSARERLNQ